MSLRDSILAADDLQKKDVKVPEWGVTLWVRVMSGTEVDAYRAASAADTSNVANMCKLVACTAVDEDGKLIFTLADTEALAKKSWTVIARIAAAAADVNMMTDKSLEKLKGNSEPSLGDAPSSASP